MKTSLGFLTEEGRTRSKNAARRISAYAVLMFLIAGASGYGIHRYWISPDLTPLQRIYFKQYAKSSWRSYLTNSHSRYTTLATIFTDPISKKDVQGAAVDNNVEPVLDEERRIVFDKNRRPVFRPKLGTGVKALVWNDVIAADADAYKWLRELMYANESIPDIWRPAWLGGLLIFFFGTIALGSVDALAQRRYLKGQAIRGTREVRPKRYERDHQNDTGYGITVYAKEPSHPPAIEADCATRTRRGGHLLRPCG
ncbi:MAG TPA: hypothetical protein VIG25_18530 [Pyrinomonadaceae bacterium]